MANSTFTDDTIDPDRDFTIRKNMNYRSTRHPTSLAGRDNKPEINTFNQLSYLEKMMVMTAFRNGVVKFIKMWQMQDFIYISTKINISTKLLFEIRKKDMQERYIWYYNFARDSHAYIAAYSKAIDEIETYKEELWKIILYSGSKDNREKIDAFKELHNLTKSGVILLKELPFLTQLSKFYDLTKLDPQRVGISRLQYEKLDKYDKGIPKLESNNYYDINDTYKENNSSTVQAMNERLGDRSNTRDDIISDVLSETNINPDNEQAIKTGDKYLEQQMKSLEKEMNAIINSKDETNKAKRLDNIKKKYYESMTKFDAIVSPEKRQTINMLKSLEDNDINNNKNESSIGDDQVF